MIITLASLVITIAIYKFSQYLYRSFGAIIFLPLLITPFCIVLLLKLSHISYETYYSGASILSLLLQPATVALAVPIYRHKHVLKKYFPEICVGVVSGAIFAIISSVGISNLLHNSTQVIESFAPRSVTTPIAMNVSDNLGGIPALTALFVIITGVVGNLLTSVVFKILKDVSPITKGLVLGVAAHATGAARAREYGILESAIASLAMVFMGIVTALIAPMVMQLCFGIFDIA